MTTKFNVGDDILIKGVVETIYIETTDNDPVYFVRVKGARTNQVYGITVKEDVMKEDANDGQMQKMWEGNFGRRQRI